jgi:cyclophilin family peptidyl-prolyl cis-trans isomerase
VKNLICAVAALAIVACAPANKNNDTAATQSASDTVATTATNTTAAPTTGGAPAAVTATTPKAGDEEKPMSYYENKIAELHTSSGEIDMRFFPDKAPGHVKNFIDLAEKGFYNGTKFHRVIPGFMIQGGDPNTISGDPSTWGTGGSGKNIPAEFNDIHHKRGIVSMARSQSPNSASSQFFICVADAGFLDRQYTVFGEVTKGMDVADKIVSADRGAQDRPNNPTTIEKIVIRDAKPGELTAADASGK